jgi:hypothetical protein
MARLETDDFEHDGVQRCLQAAEPARLTRLPACQQNEHWKDQTCRARHTHAADVQRCSRDPDFIPRVVEHGPGTDRPPDRLRVGHITPW